MDQGKRECILTAAAKAFARLGFKKASVDSIARDSGVAKGTIYLVCESKEDLFYQVLHRDLRSWVGDCAKVIDRRRRADELLEHLARTAVERLDAYPLVRDFFLGIATGELAGWTEQLEELRALGRSNIDEVLRLGVRQGIFHEALDVEETSVVLQEIQQGIYLRATRDPDPRAFDRRAKAALKLVLDGLRARPTADG